MADLQPDNQPAKQPENSGDDLVVPPIPSRVNDPRHLAHLRSLARDVISNILVEWESRGPDGSSGTLLNDQGCERLSQVFDYEIFPQLFEYGSERDPASEKEEGYHDSYQGLSSSDDEADQWKVADTQEDDPSDGVASDWFFDDKYEHLEPIVLAGAALADGGHILFVAIYDENREAIILPSAGKSNYNFLDPSFVSKNELIGMVVRFYSNGDNFWFDSADLYLSQVVVESDLACLTSGDSSNFLELSIRKISMWEGDPPDKFDVLRSRITPSGETEVFVMVSKSIEGKVSASDEPGSSVEVQKEIDKGAFWCRFGIQDGILTDLVDYIYFPPDIKLLETAIYQDLFPEEALFENQEFKPAKPPFEEMQEDASIVLEKDEGEIDYHPDAQLELYFEDLGYQRIVELSTRDDQALLRNIISFAIETLNSSLPLDIDKNTPIPCFLFEEKEGGSFIVGIPPEHLKFKYDDQCDLFLIKCWLSNESTDTNISTRIYGLAIQEQPFVNSALGLIDRDPRSSILMPFLLARMPEGLVNEEVDTDQLFNELVCSVGVKDRARKSAEIESQIVVLMAFTKSRAEHMVLIRRNRDGGVIVFDDEDKNTGMELVSSTTPSNASYWAE